MGTNPLVSVDYGDGHYSPFAPRSGQQRPFNSPAHRLNQKQYHPHWLHNLQVCASCQGFRGET